MHTLFCRAVILNCLHIIVSSKHMLCILAVVEPRKREVGLEEYLYGKSKFVFYKNKYLITHQYNKW